VTHPEAQEPRRPLGGEAREARRPVDVAVGVLIDPEDRFLLTSRPDGKVYAGYWEFPGGKVEPGETVEAALRRELHEELGITIGAAQPWQVALVDYPHARVRLHFCKVFAWRGAFEMREGQRMAWQTLPVQVAPLLPGTLPVLAWFAAERGHGGPTYTESMDWLDAVKWDAQGLVAAIAQEAGSGDVLMVAWMNREALAETARRGEAVYWSRSRQRLWHKGEESGHIQKVHELRLDCDGDAVLLKVTQLGHEPGIACHTGRHSCFFQRWDNGGWHAVDAVLKDPESIYR
jgi:mutator protein MutT